MKYSHQKLFIILALKLINEHIMSNGIGKKNFFYSTVIFEKEDIDFLMPAFVKQK